MEKRISCSLERMILDEILVISLKAIQTLYLGLFYYVWLFIRMSRQDIDRLICKPECNLTSAVCFRRITRDKRNFSMKSLKFLHLTMFTLSKYLCFVYFRGSTNCIEDCWSLLILNTLSWLMCSFVSELDFGTMKPQTFLRRLSLWVWVSLARVLDPFGVKFTLQDSLLDPSGANS